MTVKWMRPTGNPIETRDTPEIREYAAENDWKEVKPRGRRKSVKAADKAEQVETDGDG